MKLSEYIEPLSRSEREALARLTGTTFLHLRNIAFSGKSCGPLLAVALDAATDGAVRRWDMRPDDWHRFWPELIGTEGAPAVPTTAEVGHVG